MKVTPNVISRRILFCLAAIGFWTACGSDQSGSHAWAQFGPSILPPQREPAGEFGPVRRLPRDPRTQTTYFRSVSSINSGNVAEGISTLQEILDQESDFFLAETPTSSQSMFGQVEQLLAKHHEEYERLFGPTARQILNDARTRQNTVGLEEVVRRFSQTTAGASALEELVQLERDSGEPARAARLLEQLARHPQNKNPRRSITEAIGLLVATGDDRQARALLARSSDLLPDAAENATLLQRKGSPAIPSIGGAPLYEWRLPFGGVSNIGGSQPAPAFTSTAWKSVLVDDTYDFWLLESPDVAERLGKDTRDLLRPRECEGV